MENPNHSEDAHQDDFHRTIKPKIISAIGSRLKNKFGKNCDIEIRDGNLFIVSQIIDEKTGKKNRERNSN